MEGKNAARMKTRWDSFQEGSQCVESQVPSCLPVKITARNEKGELQTAARGAPVRRYKYARRAPKTGAGRQ